MEEIQSEDKQLEMLLKKKLAELYNELDNVRKKIQAIEKLVGKDKITETPKVKKINGSSAINPFTGRPYPIVGWRQYKDAYDNRFMNKSEIKTNLQRVMYALVNLKEATATEITELIQKEFPLSYGSLGVIQPSLSTFKKLGFIEFEKLKGNKTIYKLVPEIIALTPSPQNLKA